MMQIINKNEGPKIAYQETNTMVFLGDNELMLNMAKYQRDWSTHIDICSNREKQLVIGTGEGLYYVAQFDILPIEYTEQVTEEDIPVPIPIDMSKVILTLWSLENPVPVEI